MSIVKGIVSDKMTTASISGTSVRYQRGNKFSLPLYVHLVVYTCVDGKRLPLLEGGPTFILIE